jgi:hypothetical protein
MTKRWFSDLKQILFLLARHKDLDVSRVGFFTQYRSNRLKERATASSVGRPEETTRKLKSCLEKFAEKIESYLNSFESRPVEGIRNLDPLSHQFIYEMFEVWSKFRAYEGNRRVLRREDHRPFARFLAAAWSDAGFPVKGPRGTSREPLTEWFVDRIRKHWCGRKLDDDDFEANSMDKRLRSI